MPTDSLALVKLVLSGTTYLFMRTNLGVVEIRSIRKLISLDVLLCFIWLIAPMVPLFNSFFPLTLRVLTFALWLLVIVLKYKGLVTKWLGRLAFRSHEFLLLFLFVIVVAVNYFFRNTNSNAQLYFAHFSLMCFALIMSSFYDVVDPRKRITILFLITITLGIQAIVSIPHFISGYNIRASLGWAGSDLTREELLDRAKRGIGSQYMYLSLAPMVFSALGLAVFFVKSYKRIIYLSVVGIVISLILCTFFGAVVLLVIGAIGVGFIFRSQFMRLKVLMWFTFTVFLVAMVYTQFLQHGNYFSSIEYKINAYISAFSTTGISAGSDITGRTGLAEVSITTFLSYPVFGIGIPPLHSYHIVGEHMPWVDYFAYFGAIGFLPLILFFFLLFARNSKLYASFLKKKRFRTQHQKNIAFYNLMLGLSFILFIVSNFISPLITVPQTYLLLIFWYTSPIRA